MKQTVWVFMVHDDWHESDRLYGIYSTREKAVAALKEYREDIACDERLDIYEEEIQ